GLYMLIFLALIVGLSLTLYAFRGASVRARDPFNILSRETFLLLNNVILLTALVTVLLGTIYPLIIEALNLGKISVGPPYFNAVFVPLMAPLLFFMGIGPQSYWQAMPPALLLARLRTIFIICLSVAVLLPWIVADRFSAGVSLGLGLAIWIIMTSLNGYVRRVFAQPGNKWLALIRIPRAYYGMLVAHIGVGLCVIGITLTSHYSIERDIRLALGEQTTLGSYQFNFSNIRDTEGSNYQGVAAEFIVTKEDKIVAQLYPQKKYYTVAEQVMGEPGIKAGLWRDLYVALGEPLAENEWSLRLYYKPFVRWIWLGSLWIIAGGLLAMSDRRYYQKKVTNHA
ncbi:MAG: cytochrome c-type biogenesis CcmF C-terminal domain-containing protein, partial [Gammaproteobacteria bacterium]